MPRCGGSLLVVILCSLAVPAAARRPTPPELVVETDVVDTVGGGTAPASKALADTIWIADWSFDSPGGCTSAGWVKHDNWILDDGSSFWCITAEFDTNVVIDGNAAKLARHDLCWGQDGYGNNWDYSMILKYRGGAAGGGSAPRLAFDYIADCEAGSDFRYVECDSLGLSEALADPRLRPDKSPEDFRDRLPLQGFESGMDWGGHVDIALIDYTPADPTAVHEVYVRFVSDGGYSDEDGNYPTQWRSPLVVDDIVVSGTAPYSEDFSAASGCADPGSGLIAGVHPDITFVNSANALPFGLWARVFPYVTDNDKCVENTTCAWLWTDPTLPAYFPDMSFGPGGAVVRSWLDNVIVSPWVSLASTPGPHGTVLSWRRFPGNDYDRGRIVQSWRVRGMWRVANTDTPAPGDSIDCVGAWQHTSSFSHLSTWGWVTSIADISLYTQRYDIPPWSALQVSLRVTDFQHVWPSPAPVTLDPGPGPYDDRIRIGRRAHSGPLLTEPTDSRWQAQDAFGAVQNGIAPGEHHSPSTNPTRRFDPVPFDTGADLGAGGIGRPISANLVTGDSIWIDVTDVRRAGGITSVKLYAAITGGPHQGKVPPGAGAGPGGFFAIAAGGPNGRWWWADLPDDYLRGGDEVVYFWGAVDAAGGFGSDPSGIPGNASGPAVTSIAQAEALTGGLLGMSALPAIDWDAGYLAAVAADPEGDVAPTPAQIAASTQRNAILYFQNANSRRRSGPLQRTSFMYSLDVLGYGGAYDVYDVQGYGNTNNQLGGRATVEHATGYALIVQDSGRLTTLTVPDGSNSTTHKIDQAGWYRNWLAGGAASEVGTATLWIAGENVVQEVGTNTLFGSFFGLSLGAPDNGTGVAGPDVAGVAGFEFEDGCAAAFAGDRFSLQGGCPTLRDYDGLLPTTGAATHRFRAGTVDSPYAAVVMNRDTGLDWNTILSSFGWFDIRDPFGGPPGQAEMQLLGKVLACVQPGGVTGVEPGAETMPRRPALHPNAPNPFNPSTRIRFDLARDGHVELRIFDAAGHLVRRLADVEMKAGHGRSVIWNGLDEVGRRVTSGVYFCRLVTSGVTATRKMVVLE